MNDNIVRTAVAQAEFRHQISAAFEGFLDNALILQPSHGGNTRRGSLVGMDSSGHNSSNNQLNGSQHGQETGVEMMVVSVQRPESTRELYTSLIKVTFVSSLSFSYCLSFTPIMVYI